jgi:hypothetical protein
MGAWRGVSAAISTAFHNCSAWLSVFSCAASSCSMLDFSQLSRLVEEEGEEKEEG